MVICVKCAASFGIRAQKKIWVEKGDLVFDFEVIWGFMEERIKSHICLWMLKEKGSKWFLDWFVTKSLGWIKGSKSLSFEREISEVETIACMSRFLKSEASWFRAVWWKVFSYFLMKYFLAMHDKFLEILLNILSFGSSLIHFHLEMSKLCTILWSWSVQILDLQSKEKFVTATYGFIET